MAARFLLDLALPARFLEAGERSAYEARDLVLGDQPAELVTGDADQHDVACLQALRKGTATGAQREHRAAGSGGEHAGEHRVGSQRSLLSGSVMGGEAPEMARLERTRSGIGAAGGGHARSLPSAERSHAARIYPTDQLTSPARAPATRGRRRAGDPRPRTARHPRPR